MILSIVLLASLAGFAFGFGVAMGGWAAEMLRDRWVDVRQRRRGW